MPPGMTFTFAIRSMLASVPRPRRMKRAGIEPRFEILQPVGDGVALVLDRREVEQLAFGDDRGDLRDRQDDDLVAPPDRDPLEVRRPRATTRTRRSRRSTRAALLGDDLGVLDPLLRAVERLAQAGLVDRLQQVVDGVHLERAHRVLVVRGDERDRAASRASSACARRRCRRAPASADRAAPDPGAPARSPPPPPCPTRPPPRSPRRRTSAAARRETTAPAARRRR